MNFNINEMVSVKLTETGRRIMKKLDLEAGRLDARQIKVDEDGYTKFQLWELMHIFGSSIRTVGQVELPFDTTIKLDACKVDEYLAERGMVVVPAEPTYKMIAAADGPLKTPVSVYKTMIRAATTHE